MVGRNDGHDTRMGGREKVKQAEKPAARPEEASCDDERAPILPPEAQDVITRKLKASYDELLRAPLPDRFGELLNQLAQVEKDGK